MEYISTGKPVHFLGLCDIRLRQNAIIILVLKQNGMVQYLNEIENSEFKYFLFSNVESHFRFQQNLELILVI